ncbi:MAG: hypothetical protein ACI8RD_001832 [Bacillariaceae sp.]|jgi:hypothetical protein
MMSPKDMYLIVYNMSCCAGWSMILISALQSLANGIPQDGVFESLANVYGASYTMPMQVLSSSTIALADLLFITQSAALLEIVHAAVGLVRSPVLVTAMQVFSRIVALVAVTYSPQAKSKLATYHIKTISDCRTESYYFSAIEDNLTRSLTHKIN